MPIKFVILLEMLGLEADFKNQALRVLPTELVDTYLTILELILLINERFIC